MAVGMGNEDFVAVDGVRLSASACGIKSGGTTDLVLMEFGPDSQTAGVFTQSHFAAAPVLLCREYLQREQSRYFLINSGNANCAVGEAGLRDARDCCHALADLAGVTKESVLPFSTGVIGERLPTDRIIAALPVLHEALGADNWLLAAQGIMTTDTRPKIASRCSSEHGFTMTGIAKGAGMIQPDMATMLAYVASDVRASQATLHALLIEAVNVSFNRVTVDSDTSTNDSTMLTATGASGLDIDKDPALREAFQAMLNELMLELAHGLIRDGEGATKFVEVNVINGRSSSDCLAIAYAIANSPLMKTALFASDANWGRIVMAIGKAPVEIDTSRLDVFLGDVQLMAQGEKHSAYTEQAGAAIMAGEEISITVDLNEGQSRETVWTSDLSHEYVRINAEYRT
jgi:glutamate N-acetyltransferase/amino-acid N-acetyltransferase